MGEEVAVEEGGRFSVFCSKSVCFFALTDGKRAEKGACHNITGVKRSYSISSIDSDLPGTN